jgi:endoglucanase
MKKKIFQIIFFTIIINEVLLFKLNYKISKRILKEDDDEEFIPTEKFDKENLITDNKTKPFKETITSQDIIKEMGLGWNLGNTLDASNGGSEGIESETSWGNPETTKEMIEEIANKGFKTIRLPTTWRNHLIDKNYTIDPKWMKRVKQIVDWCIESGLYVILNVHHDNADLIEDKSISYGSGYFPLLKDFEESEMFLYNVWKQITIAFNNGYDHHLIFEGLNEPRLKGHKNEWNFRKEDSICEEACSVLNQYLDLIVRTIRESKGNNYKRFIMVTPLSAGFNSAIKSDFVFPKDKFNSINKLILSVHMYEPYDFTMNKDIELNVFKDEYKSIVDDNFSKLYKQYVKEGYNIIIGEFGARDKNNLEERIKWGKYYIETATKNGIACVIWDNGIFREEKEGVGSFYALLHRKELTWETDELVDTYIKAAEPK